MKRIFSISLAIVCLTALLAGCGSSADAPKTDDPQDTSTYTLEQISDSADLTKLLERHSAVSCVQTFTDGAGSSDTVIRSQYTMKDGSLQLISAYEDGSGNAIYYRQAYADSTHAGAEYGQDSDGGLYLSLYSSSDAYTSAIDAWLVGTPGSEGETITETSRQDDAVVVSTRTNYRDESDMYAVTLYYINPDTGDLLYTETTSYSTQDDSVVSKIATEISYDTTEDFGVSPYTSVTGSSDYCEVSLILNPQQDDMTTFWYPVAHGTAVSFVAEDGVKLYSDEALTQALDPLAIDISGTACNIFVVRG